MLFNVGWPAIVVRTPFTLFSRHFQEAANSMDEAFCTQLGVIFYFAPRLSISPKSDDHVSESSHFLHNYLITSLP